MQDQSLETWSCGKCPYILDLPPETEYAQYIDTLMRIREHRFAHLVDALSAATDEQVLTLCDDESGRAKNTEPVQAEDAAYVLAGVTELLKADLPRAREEVWNND